MISTQWIIIGLSVILFVIMLERAEKWKNDLRRNIGQAQRQHEDSGC